MMALRFPQPQIIYRHILVILLHWVARQLGATILPKGWMMFDPELAKAFDNINTAIIYQKITSWIESNARRKHNIINGKAWSYNSYPDWARKEFIWLHPKTVGSHIRKLEQAGRLVSSQLNPDPRKREKWYSSPDSADGSQLRLWQEEEMAMVAATSGDDSNKALSKAIPQKAKRQTTPAAARARTKPLHVGAVATFSGMGEKDQDLPEPKHQAAEAHSGDEGSDELTPARPSTPIPPPPSPTWTEIFTCIDPEIAGWLQGDGDRLKAWCGYVPGRGLGNPGGFVRKVMRVKDSWPPKNAEVAATANDGNRYITGIYADFIEH